MYSTLLQVYSKDLTSEAEVETRFLMKVFKDLGYPDSAIIPKKHIPSLRINDGRKSTTKEVDFILKDKDGIARIIVEAKSPEANINDAWGQAASYALSFNSDKKEGEKIQWLLISNGFVTSLFQHDCITPVITLQLEDFTSGIPPYVMLRNYIKYDNTTKNTNKKLEFRSLSPFELNKKFANAHNMIRKSESLAPHDAFFEFCKFIFIKIREDKKRKELGDNIPANKIPLTIEWLDVLEETDPHPIRNILFVQLREELEEQITSKKKRRIFDKQETLMLSSNTCRKLVEIFHSIDLSSIDEDLNGRMFEVFLNASIRGKDLGQFFTPRSVVDFMTRISLRDVDLTHLPLVLDACCGTAGFLIEVMAYLQGRLRNDNRFNENEKKQIFEKICNECLFGVEANPRTSRIARINMYLHGDGGSHIFRGDGLNKAPTPTSDMTPEERKEIEDYGKVVRPSMFDIILSNPPFSMKYDSGKDDEKNIIKQFDFTENMKSVKSSVLFMARYQELLKPGKEILIVLDDTLLNGKSFEDFRGWIMDKFVVLGVHSLPFNAFFKAKANIKTSILHLRKKITKDEKQGSVFMSISNNVGHDNSLKDTPSRNNLHSILSSYLDWRRTGHLKETIIDNSNKEETLECPMQYWLTNSAKFSKERFDAFFYCIDLRNVYKSMTEAQKRKEIEVINASNLNLVAKLSGKEKLELDNSGEIFKYIEIGDVTSYGLITSHITGFFSELPSRGEYQIKKGDVLIALNNSSRGTVVIVPQEFDGAICTSGFFVIRPKNEEEGLLLWYCLRSEYCKKQIYYLAQTASQPELKMESWNKYFKIPLPVGEERIKAVRRSKQFFSHLQKLINVDSFNF